MIDIAIKAAREAGQILRENFQNSNSITIKSDNSFQTRIDKLAEEKIITTIKSSHPDHSINAEESGMSQTKSKYLWLVDPLDGTTNYATHIPFFSTSISLLENGQLVLGVVYDPLNDELFTAKQGEGTYLNDLKIQVSDTSSISAFKIGYSRSGSSKKLFSEVFSRAENQVRTPKILGSTALQLSYVAAGRLDADFSFAQSPWDISAGTLLINEAGGKVTDFENKPWSLSTKNIIASNGKNHDGLLKILNSTPGDVK